MEHEEQMRALALARLRSDIQEGLDRSRHTSSGHERGAFRRQALARPAAGRAAPYLVQAEPAPPGACVSAEQQNSGNLWFLAVSAQRTTNQTFSLSRFRQVTGLIAEHRNILEAHPSFVS